MKEGLRVGRSRDRERGMENSLRAGAGGGWFGVFGLEFGLEFEVGRGTPGRRKRPSHGRVDSPFSPTYLRASGEEERRLG